MTAKGQQATARAGRQNGIKNRGIVCAAAGAKHNNQIHANAPRRTGGMQRLIGDSSGCQKIKRREDHLRNEFQMAVSRMDESLALLLGIKIKGTAIYQQVTAQIGRQSRKDKTTQEIYEMTINNRVIAHPTDGTQDGIKYTPNGPLTRKKCKRTGDSQMPIDGSKDDRHSKDGKTRQGVHLTRQ